MSEGTRPRIGDLIGIRELPESFYRRLDWNLVVPVGGSLWLLGAAVAVAVLPFLPPTHFVGDAGWAIVGAIVVGALASGTAMIMRPRMFGPVGVLLMGYAGALGLGVAQVLVGDAGPFALLFVVLAAYHGILHPPNRLARLIATIIVVNAGSVAIHGMSELEAVRVVTTTVLVLLLSIAALIYAQRVRQLLAQVDTERDRAEALARTDVLTGLGNRRAMEEALGDQLAQAQRYGRALSLVLLDVDDFKKTNDTYGHEAGDQALVTVANALRSEVRHPDRCFRWGGDEFIVVLPETALPGGETAVRRLAETLMERTAARGLIPISITGGVAEARPDDNIDTLVSRADAALLERKRERSRR